MMNRQMREQELLRWMRNDEGITRITDAYMKARGIPDGQWPMDMIGTLVRSEMVPAILDFEFPRTDV